MDIFVLHTALLLKQHALFKLHAFKFKMPVAVILQCLTKYRYMHRLQLYSHATVSDDFFFLLSH